MKIGLRLALVAAVSLVAPAALADDELALTAPPNAPAAPAAPAKGPAAKGPAVKSAAGSKADAEAPKGEAKDAKDAKDAKKEAPPEERALRGVVVIERAGQPLALGTVLANDGRVLTALSPLASGNDLDVRFPDNTTVRVKLGHHDRMWDLALLVPQAGRWKDGLVASAKDPVRADATIHSFSLVRSKLAAVPLVLRAHRTLLGGDDKQLENAIEIGSRVSPLDLGAPIIDEEGRAVGVLARGCAPNDNRPCTPVAFGAPITAIRSFLRSVPPTAVPPAAWLGIQGVAETSGVARGVRVLSVHPASPADEAQLKGGDKAASDIILAVDGTPVTSPESLAEAIRAHGVGEKVPLMVFSQGKYRTVSVLLRAAPDAKPAPPQPANPAELPVANEPAHPHPAPAAPPAKKR